MTDLVTTEFRDGVAVITFDDGKANALSHEAITALDEAFDKAEADADAIAFFGREGKFSAGFDLNVMRDGPEAAQNLTRRGAELCLKIYGFPRPVVVGSDGHALAAGALVLLSCDVRIGSDTEGKIGLPEVALGMPLPVFGTELARDRLSKRHFTAAAQLATTYGPEQAVDVGFLDQVVPLADLRSTVLARAKELGETLDKAGFAATRRNTRAATIAYITETLDADMRTFTVGAP